MPFADELAEYLKLPLCRSCRTVRAWLGVGRPEVVGEQVSNAKRFPQPFGDGAAVHGLPGNFGNG